jgi:hypothetical protein
MEGSRPFVEYYLENKISPVSQDISNLEKHYEMRGSLYRTLGIPSLLFKDRTVIEFGPGSGHNALFTQSLLPSSFYLVEGNPVGLNSIRRLFENKKDVGGVRIIESFIEDFNAPDKFDFVLCEGVISTQQNPKNFLQHIASFAIKGGIVVITCMDYVSYLSEILRKFVSLCVINESASAHENVEILLPIWKDHLDSLNGMTRPYEDWILDNMLQPFYGPLLSVKDSIEALGDNFYVYNSSPNFFTDWRWFKTLKGDECSNINKIVVGEYMRNVHNFLDYRRLFPPRDEELNRELLELCHSVYAEVAYFMINRDKMAIGRIVKLTLKIENNLRLLEGNYSKIFSDFRYGLNQCILGNLSTTFGDFTTFFGRGQQYLSFIRHA